MEERISRVRENFNLQLTRKSELAEINSKLDELTRKVDELSKAMAKKSAPRKAPAKKKSSTRTRKT